MSRAAARQAEIEALRRCLMAEAIGHYCYDSGSLARIYGLQARIRRLKAGRGGRRPRRMRGGSGDMAWKRLEMPVPVKKRPAMGLSSGGRLSWTVPLHEVLGEPSHVNVFYDADTSRLGLKAAAGENGLPAQKNRQINIKTLLLAEGVWGSLALPVSLRPAVLDEAEGIWAISLAEEGSDAAVPPQP